MTERIDSPDEQVADGQASFSGPPYSVGLTVWRTAPLRIDPFVKRASNRLEIRSDDNIVEWIDLSGGGAVELRAYFQAAAQRIDSRNSLDGLSGAPIWNDFWLYTIGPHQHRGWISMVDVKQGHDGEPLPNLTPASFAYQYGTWAPVVWSL